MKSFEQVIEEHGPALLRYCASRVGPERAEDCFQETMVSALRSYVGMREEKAVRSWLFTIATRKSIDMYRVADRTPKPTETAQKIEGSHPDVRPGNSDIWSLVEQLPEKQSTALLLRYRGGLSHREVGEVMEISESAARRNSFEGLKRLRAERSSWA